METARLVDTESGESTSDIDILAQHGDVRSSNWSRVKLGVLTFSLALAGVVAYTCTSGSGSSISRSDLKGVTAKFDLSDWVDEHQADDNDTEDTPVDDASETYWYSVDHEVSDLGHKVHFGLNHLTGHNATTFSGDEVALALPPAWATEFPNSSTVKITWDLKYDDSDDDSLYDLYMPVKTLAESDGTNLSVIVFMPGTSNEKEKQKFGCQMLASWGRVCIAMQHNGNKMKSGQNVMMYAGIANWKSDDKTYPNCKDTCTDDDSCSKWACTGCPKCYVNQVDLIGYSDGGITAFNMAMDDDYNTYFSKVVIIEGASDKKDPNPNTPPMLIMHTENDGTVTFNGVDDFVQAQEKTGAVVKHIYWSDGYHWPFKWGDWHWEINRFLTDPLNYEYTKWDSVDYFGDWETISDSAGCLENDEGIEPFASYYITKHIDLCQGMCQEVKGCQAIDYLVGMAYKRPSSDDSPTNPNCYLYYKACTNPTRTFDSDSGVTITSSKVNLGDSVAFPARSPSAVEE